MDVFGKRIDGPKGRRQTPREQVTLAAAALTLEGSHSVLIEDVAPTGARLRSRHVGRPGQQMLIRAGEVKVLASVIWSEQNECGIVFDEPLDYSALELLKQEAAWATLLGMA